MSGATSTFDAGRFSIGGAQVRLTLLYFAVLADRTGTPREDVDAPVTDVASLAAWIEARHAPLAGRLATVRFAVEEQFAEPARALRDGDVVALIPPVAGG